MVSILDPPINLKRSLDIPNFDQERKRNALLPILVIGVDPTPSVMVVKDRQLVAFAHHIEEWMSKAVENWWRNAAEMMRMKGKMYFCSLMAMTMMAIVGYICLIWLIA